MKKQEMSIPDELVMTVTWPLHHLCTRLIKKAAHLISYNAGFIIIHYFHLYDCNYVVFAHVIAGFIHVLFKLIKMPHTIVLRHSTVKITVLMLVLLHICMISPAQIPPVMNWKKCLGGFNIDKANSIRQTNDGGYIVAGFTQSSDGDVSGLHGASDFWVVKLDATGAIQWQKCYGGANDDQANCIRQTSDGGYIVAGYTKSGNGDVTGLHGNWDYWVIKLDNTGTLTWQETYGGSDLESATSVEQTSDGGYVIGGYTQSTDGNVTGLHSPGMYDAWIVKISSTGTMQWQKTLGGENYDNAFVTKQTSDGGYIVGAYTASSGGDISGSHGGGDYWVVKLNNTGVIQWQKTLGGTNWDVLNDVVQLNDGSYLAAGFVQSSDGDVTSNHGQNDAWIVKLDNSGNKLWEKNFGGSYKETANSISQTTDGGYIIAGYTNSNDGDVSGFHGTPGAIIGGNIAPDFWVVKTDNTGNIQWQKTMGGDYYDQANCIQQTTDGGYIVAGHVISHTANDGDIAGLHNNVSNPGATVSDYWVVKLSLPSATGITTFGNSEINVYPNPISNIIYINSSLPLKRNAKIFDAVGKSLNITIENSRVDLSGIQSGLYFIEFQDENNTVFSKKILKQN